MEVLVVALVLIVALALVLWLWRRERRRVAEVTDILDDLVAAAADDVAGSTTAGQRLKEPLTPDEAEKLITQALVRTRIESGAVRAEAARQAERFDLERRAGAVWVRQIVENATAIASATEQAATAHVAPPPVSDLVPPLGNAVPPEFAAVYDQATTDLLTLVRDTVTARCDEHRRAQSAVTQLRGLLDQLPGLIAARSGVLQATAPEQTPWFADSEYDLADRVLALVGGAVEDLVRGAERYLDEVVLGVVLGINTTLLPLAGTLEETIATAQLAVEKDKQTLLGALLDTGGLIAQLNHRIASLHLLAGGWSGVQRGSASLEDVVSSALSRVSGYTRVRRSSTGQQREVPGPVVEPLAVVLAHVIDNAVRASLHSDEVELKVSVTSGGVVIVVDDAGLGMTEDELWRYRTLIGGEYPVRIRDLGNPAQIGFAVCGVLAREHGIRIYLEESPLGGIRVVVGLSPELAYVPTTQDPRVPLAAAAVRPAAIDAPDGVMASNNVVATAPESSPADELPSRRHRRRAVPPPSLPQPVATDPDTERTATEGLGAFQASITAAIPGDGADSNTDR